MRNALVSGSIGAVRWRVADGHRVLTRCLPREQLLANEASPGVIADNDKDLANCLIVRDRSGLLACGLTNHCSLQLATRVENGE